jgi:hypothetical protein
VAHAPTRSALLASARLNETGKTRNRGKKITRSYANLMFRRILRRPVSSDVMLRHVRPTRARS